MKLPSLVKLPKHRRFDFQPRHYDPVKEELDERVRRIEQEMEDEENGVFRPSKHLKFDRNYSSGSKKGFSLQMILVTFFLTNLFLIVKLDNLSNLAWIMIILAEAALVYLKVKRS